MKKINKSVEIIPYEKIEQRILLIRGQKVMLDRHLAELYGVPTMRLNEQVKRNIGRFPNDFMFQLTLRGKNERASERLSCFWRDDSSEHGVFPDVPRRSRSERLFAERG